MIDPDAIDADVRAVLVRAVWRFCPPWLSAHRDDLVQMAAVKLIRSGSDAELTDGYLWRTAYSVVVDEIRRRRRRDEVGMSPSINERIANSDELSPETIARGAEIGTVLIQCLGELSDARRRAVALYLQDHSIPEVARILGWNRKKASNAVYRGLSDLRGALRARGVEP